MNAEKSIPALNLESSNEKEQLSGLNKSGKVAASIFVEKYNKRVGKELISKTISTVIDYDKVRLD